MLWKKFYRSSLFPLLFVSLVLSGSAWGLLIGGNVGGSKKINASLTPKGTWASLANYSSNSRYMHFVSFSSASWAATANNLNQRPSKTSAYWGKVTGDKGDIGPGGPTGADGIGLSPWINGQGGMVFQTNTTGPTLPSAGYEFWTALNDIPQFCTSSICKQVLLQGDVVSGASTIGQLSDWPVGVDATELSYLDGLTGNVQSQINSISSAGPPHVSSGDPAVGAWKFNTTTHELLTRESNGDIRSIALTLKSAADTTPDAFTFTDQTDVTLTSTITSAAITVAGINWPSVISVTGGTYDINSSGTFVSTAGTVNNGDTVRVRHTSSSSHATATSTVGTIGGVSATFTSTTIAASGPTILSYFNANSATNGQALQKGSGTVTVGASVTTTTGSVGNALTSTTDNSAGRFSWLTASNIDQGIGTMGFYVTIPSAPANGAELMNISDSSPYFYMAYVSGSTLWRFYYRNSGQFIQISDSVLTQGTTHFLELAWNASSNLISYRVDGGSWSETANTTGTTPTGTSVRFLNFGTHTSATVDQIIISSGYKDDIYSVRNNTSF